MDMLFTLQTLSRYGLIWQQMQEGADLIDDEVIVANVMKEHPEFDRFWNAGETAVHPQEIDGYIVTPLIHAGLHVVAEKQISERSPEEVETTLKTLVARGVSRHDAMHQIIAIWGNLYFQSIRQGASLYEWEYIELLTSLTRSP